MPVAGTALSKGYGSYSIGIGGIGGCFIDFVAEILSDAAGVLL